MLFQTTFLINLSLSLPQSILSRNRLSILSHIIAMTRTDYNEGTYRNTQDASLDDLSTHINDSNHNVFVTETQCYGDRYDDNQLVSTNRSECNDTSNRNEHNSSHFASLTHINESNYNVSVTETNNELPDDDDDELLVFDDVESLLLDQW